jgi:hypothetical protein
VDRDVSSVSAPHAIGFRAVKAGKTGANAFSFAFTTLGFPRFRVAFWHKDADTVAGFKFRVGILGLIEYKGDISMPFNRSNVVRRLSLMGRGKLFSDIVVGTETVNGVTFKTATTSYTYNAYPAPHPVFTVTARAAPKWLNVNKNVTLGPDRVKFDIEIDNFPFSSAGDSYLGVVVNIQSVAARVSRAFNKSDPHGHVDIAGGGRWSYIRSAWKQKESAQGWSNVVATQTMVDTEDYTEAGAEDDDKDAAESSSIQVFYFDDPSHPSKVVWDPEAGLDPAVFDASAAAPAAAPLSLLVTAAAALVAFVAARRN